MSIIMAQLPSFVCGDSLMDTRDGQVYKTVQIGNQCWMARNINIGTWLRSDKYQKDDGRIEKYCYNDSEAICKACGGLYDWDEAMQYVKTPGDKGICPEGWHIPTREEWEILADYLSTINTARGRLLKEAGTKNWKPPNEGANNSTGFNGLPCGSGWPNDSKTFFGNLHNIGEFWSSSLKGPRPWSFSLYLELDDVYGDFAYKGIDKSVRCLKDD